MKASEYEKVIDEIVKEFQEAKITKTQTIQKLNQVKREMKTPKEKKELAHRIIKIILEVLLQIITMGLPAIISKKTIFKH